MIHFTTGNLLLAPTEALVNTVNTVGVMGKGIALQFKETYPHNFAAYKAAVKVGEVMVGKMFAFRIEASFDAPAKYILNFPTKAHWRNPSKLSFIEEGLNDLVNVITSLNIKSIAIPPLGSGNGGLDWQLVKPLILQKLSVLQDVDIFIYEPATITELTTESAIDSSLKLTKTNALLLALLHQYTALDEVITEFAAVKLLYFLQRFGQTNLKLKFVKGHYGPYSNQVSHLMYPLRGTYLHGMELRSNKPFDPLGLRYELIADIYTYLSETLNQDEQTRFEKLRQFMVGFEDAYSLELLSSIDFILTTTNATTLEEVVSGIQGWNERKRKKFAIRDIEITYRHIQQWNACLVGVG